MAMMRMMRLRTLVVASSGCALRHREGLGGHSHRKPQADLEPDYDGRARLCAVCTRADCEQPRSQLSANFPCQRIEHRESRALPRTADHMLCGLLAALIGVASRQRARCA